MATSDWPTWFTEFRQHQRDAINEVVDALSRVDVVFVNAPPGSGKTVLAEAVRRELDVTRAVYMCSSLTLQDQFARDFPYAKVLKGRSNYGTVDGGPGITAADCTKFAAGKGSQWCYYCPEVDNCPYERAKRDAMTSELAVVNSTYFLTENNFVGRMKGSGGFELVIADECDTLESELMRFTEFRVTDWRLRQLKLTAPKKGSHAGTIAGWLRDVLLPQVTARVERLEHPGDEKEAKERTSWVRLHREARWLAESLERESDSWVRDNDAGPLVFKPVTVSQWGKDLLWQHGRKWLCMSGTIISPDELADSLGLEADWEVVNVPMTFPVNNRRINVVPVANMVAKEKESEWPRLAQAISNVLDLHREERVLVHTVSYNLASYLAEALERTNGDRNVFVYRKAGERALALQRFSETSSAVLLASSMDRGVDLPDDLCRVVVVAKVPFPYLGDKQVSARLHTAAGSYWYTVQTVRSLVQMTGRGVRSETDWCVTYVLDKQFVSNVMRNKRLLPKWWMDAVDMTFPMKELLK